MPRAWWLLGCNDFLFSAALSKRPPAVSSHTEQWMGLMGLMGLDGETKWQKFKKITSKGNYSEKSCIFAFENKT